VLTQHYRRTDGEGAKPLEKLPRDQLVKVERGRAKDYVWPPRPPWGRSHGKHLDHFVVVPKMYNNNYMSRLDVVFFVVFLPKNIHFGISFFHWCIKPSTLPLTYFVVTRMFFICLRF